MIAIMKLSPGSRLDHYEIVELIGKGGMGEVYRAKDTRLPRDAAIKVSAAQFTERFARETKIIAGLNHPNICTLYDVGPNYLVMELIEGPTLADRIKEGALSLAEASGIARQVADALEYAHEKGVVHRDLKPGNIKIRPDGVVKVLDFGLAKVGGIAVAQSDQSPTLTLNATAAGMILGTAAYMSPEQAKGKEVDKRSDIYAFGIVFYEMLSGAPPHKGDTLQETLASVLKDEPDLNQVPAQAHRLLKRCLEKDPQKRLRHIGDVMALLDDAPAPSSATQPASTAPAPKTKRNWLRPAVAILLLLAGVTLGALYFRSPPPAVQEVRSQIPKPEGLTFNAGIQAAISPDGRWLAFHALGPDNVSRIYVRSIDSLEVRPLPGSEGVLDLSPPPFWSYDSRFVVFGVPGKLKKAEVTGTPAQTIADITGQSFAQGGSWNRYGLIVFGKPLSNLLQVSAAGGTPVAITALAPGEIAHRWPQFLPDGRRFLYQRVSSSADKTGIYVGSLDLKPDQQSMQPLLLTNRQAYWVAPEGSGKSFLLIQREETLLAQPFDTGTLQLSGVPYPIATGVGSFASRTNGLWSIARNGTLLYREGGTGIPRLLWRDLTGKVIGDPGTPNRYGDPAVSPEGGRAAFQLIDAQGNGDIWVRDLTRGNDTRLTFDPRLDASPVWSPDGKKIIFSANRGGSMDLYEKSADGAGEERLLFKSDQDKTPTSWSRDGRFLLFDSVDPKTSDDLWILPLDQSKDTLKPLVYLKTEFREGSAQFSPDGRWIAYNANPSGNFQVYVRPFAHEQGGQGAGAASAASGPQWMVSTTEGDFPRWSGDGKRLFFVGMSNAFMVADIQPGVTFQSGTPRRLFGDVQNFPFGSTLAGDRFLFADYATATPGPPPPFTVVLNWYTRLKN
jgi:serine/threonine protein kinase